MQKNTIYVGFAETYPYIQKLSKYHYYLQHGVYCEASQHWGDLQIPAGT
jgi:hypothetical protein